MKSDLLKNKKILVLSHISDLNGPTEALANFLQGASLTLSTVFHPLYYCQNNISQFSEIKSRDGKDYTRKWKKSRKFLISTLQEICLSVFWSFRYGGTNADIIIGIDPLNCVVALLLKCRRKKITVIYYTIDWTSQRFQNPLLNFVYHKLDLFCVKFSDYCWSISPVISEIRAEQGLLKSKNIHVPVGFGKISETPKSINESRKGINFVLLGALAPSKGVDLVLKVWPEIFKKFPWSRLHIIGKTPSERIEYSGSYEPYEPKIDSLKGVQLHGLLSYSAALFALEKMHVGVALYDPDPRNISVSADPSRVKDYLGSGLPVIISNAPPIAQDVSEQKMGHVSNYDKASLAAAFRQYCEQPSLVEAHSKNALEFMGSFTWTKIFKNAFKESGFDF